VQRPSPDPQRLIPIPKGPLRLPYDHSTPQGPLDPPNALPGPPKEPPLHFLILFMALLYLFRASSFLNVPSKPIFQLEVLIFFTHNNTLQLFGYLNTKKYFSKTISEQVTFLMSLLNPFSNLKYLSFSPETILYRFLVTSTQRNIFQKSFQSKLLS
jgi:hypothetical protein